MVAILFFGFPPRCDSRRGESKTLKNMYDGMSVYPRLHFTSGIVMAAKKLGLIKTAGENKSTDVIVRLGLRLTEFVLTPRDKCTHVEAIVGKSIAHATAAELRWPCQGGSFDEFAGPVFDLMVVCHSVQWNGLGLPGGRTLNKNPKDNHQSLEAWIQAPLPKTEKGFVTKSKAPMITSSSTSRGISYSPLIAAILSTWRVICVSHRAITTMIFERF